MAKGNSEQGFDDYRLKRQRRRVQSGGPQRPLGEGQDALRQLEEAEWREAKDQQLSREVHEFFTSATKQAATIVSKVAQTAKEEIGERLTSEMEEFLFDALQRMNSFVMQMLQRRNGQGAEQEVETHVRNLLVPVLDGFRNAGTAAVPDKHMGQDPFATDTDALRGELTNRVPGVDAVAAAPEVNLPADLLPVDAELPPLPVPVTRTTANVPPGKATPATKSAPAVALTAEQERFKEALKNLVRQGMMTREEARAAWQTKLQPSKS